MATVGVATAVEVDSAVELWLQTVTALVESTCCFALIPSWGAVAVGWAMLAL